MENKKRVLFLTNVPSPYRVEFFNELGKHTELTVLFEKSTSSERDKSWEKYNFKSFEAVIMNGISVSADSAFCTHVISYIKKEWDAIIVCDASTPTGMLAIQYMKNHKIHYWIEGDGGFAKSGKGFKESVKRHFISGADKYLSTSVQHDDYYLTYGASKDKIFRYPFTSVSENDIQSNALTHEQRRDIKRKIGIEHEYMALGVGQFIERKGFDVLLKAAEYLPENVAICIVGGKPTEEYLRLANGDKRIHFIDHILKDELKKYYMATDVFVLPTREDIWGLVINEAMACALPVVTTDRCIAGTELVKDGVNGHIVPVDSPKETAEMMIDCLKEENNPAYSENSLSIIKEYTIEKMAARHMELLCKKGEV